jgi:hypothetical protein
MRFAGQDRDNLLDESLLDTVRMVGKPEAISFANHLGESSPSRSLNLEARFGRYTATDGKRFAKSSPASPFLRVADDPPEAREPSA